MRWISLLATALAASSTLVGLAAAAADSTLTINSVTSTYWNFSSFLAHDESPSISPVPGDAPTATVNSTATTPLVIGVKILDARSYQEMLGSGVGVTDAVSIVLQDLKAAHPDVYWEVLKMQFDQSSEWRNKGGSASNIVRFSLGATDFGFQQYTYDDTADGTADTNLTLFNLDRGPKIWMTLRDILTVNPDVYFFPAPWSQPGWMKGHVNGSLICGSVETQYEQAYARYLVKAMQGIIAKGIKPHRLSLQNEPLYCSDNYPGTKMTAEQQQRLGRTVRVALDAAGLQSIGLIAYDHNWDAPDYATTVFDAGPDTFSAVAWHCYAGQPSAQDVFNAAYPNREIHMTECTRISQYFNEPWQNMKSQFRDLLYGSINGMSRSILLWNGVLQTSPDGFTTPHLPKVCTNCLAPILVYSNASNTPSGMKRVGSPPVRRSALSPRPINPFRPYYKLTSDHAALHHLGRAIRPVYPGETAATRIGVTTTETDAGGRVLVQAFRTDTANGNGDSRFSLLIFSQNDHFGTGIFEDATITVEFRGQVFNITVPPGYTNIDWFAPRQSPLARA